MYVIFLYGRPATGKYTIGRIVADELGIPLFHNHLTVDLVGSLFEFGTPEFVAMREKIWLDAFRSAADSDKSFVFTFNPENTVEQSTIDKMKYVIEGAGGAIVFVELSCVEDEIEERIANENRAEFRKLTDVDLYRNLRDEGVFDSPVMPEALISINTTEITAGAAAKEIVTVVREKVLRIHA